MMIAIIDFIAIVCIANWNWIYNFGLQCMLLFNYYVHRFIWFDSIRFDCFNDKFVSIEEKKIVGWIDDKIDKLCALADLQRKKNRTIDYNLC